MGSRTELRVRGPLDLGATLGPLCHGRLDPTVRFVGGTFWRASRTPEGPATQAVRVDPGSGLVRAAAWGPGASVVLDGLAALLGAGDDIDGWQALLAARPDPPPPGWSVVADLARRFPGLRIPRTGAVFEACVPSVLEQKVTGIEAKRSYRALVAAVSELAPGPEGGPPLLLPPSPAAVAALPSWDWHRCGVERRRAETLRRAARAAGRLEEAATMTRAAARARLTAIDGIGAWTAAEVAAVALGDPDAVSIGDFHLPHQVSWTLTGRPRGDDATMLRLLEPWRGQRGRVLRLIVAAGITAPRYGPRLALRSIRTS